MDPRARGGGGRPVPLTRPVPPLHLVTDDRVVERPDFLDRGAAALRAGGDRVAIHLRAHGHGGRALDRWAQALRALCEGAGAELWVNDRADVALAARADGVQVGRRGLPLDDLRALVGRGVRLGYSAHSAAEARAAAAAGADLVLLGPVYATASHPGAPPLGLDALAEASAAPVPVLAIGGITPERAREARSRGASGVAVVRGAWEGPAAETAARVRALLEAWSRQ